MKDLTYNKEIDASSHASNWMLPTVHIKLLSVPPITVPPPPFPHSGLLISTTASLVVLWVATMAAFGVVTAVLLWQNFKLKRKGMLGHMDDIEMNVSTCSWQVLVLPFSFSLPTKEPLPLLPSPSSSPQRPWQHPTPTKSQLLFSGEGPSVTMQ